MPEKQRYNVLYFILFFWVAYFAYSFWAEDRTVAPISYSEFRQLSRDGKIAEVILQDDILRGKFKEPREDGKAAFVTTKIDDNFAQELDEKGIAYSRVIPNTAFWSIFAWVLPMLIFFGIWIFLMRKLTEKSGFGGAGALSVGKSKAKIYAETDIKTTFSDVAGVDEAKAELQEIVNFLRDPQSYGKLGARMPKGILLVGPPGTGKTLLAKAVAGESKVPFFSISGSEFVEMFVGVGAARVRDLFEQARKRAPCIIFIDELDALGKARTLNPAGGGHDEKEQTLNQLLAELDGFDTQAGVILLAATNRPEILDPALLRAGRFDRQVLVDRPDRQGRKQILSVHIRKIRTDDSVPLDEIAAMTPGFTGADLANLVNEAALGATRRGAAQVELIDFTQAIERIVAGLERKNRLLNPNERRTVAYHEMGHALVASALPGGDKVHKISIIPRGIGALGYTIQRPTEDRYLMTRDELLNKMTILMGGRGAERVVFEKVSTGAADDLVRATDIARNIVTRYGMSSKLGPMAYETDSGGFLGPTAAFDSRRYSEDTAREIDCAVRELLEESVNKAEEILRLHRATLDRGAALLLEKETLLEEDLRAILPLDLRPAEKPEPV